MPYKSMAQMRYMHARQPEIAARWDRKYGDPRKLPEYMRRRRARKPRKA
jgi:hypothetical protein